MRLSEFVPIEDDFSEADSLNETVFGPAFHVVDETGMSLTSVRNSSLMRQALALKAGADALAPAEVAAALKALAASGRLPHPGPV